MRHDRSLVPSGVLCPPGHRVRPTGIMMTSRKMREHLTHAEAEALQADVTEQGGMLLIYKERRPLRMSGSPPRVRGGSQKLKA